MPRIRLGNVRLGGGRKASIGFHAGPIGITFGGRRKRSSSGSSSNEASYSDSEMDELTEPEVRALLIARIQYGQIGKKRIPRLIWWPLTISLSYCFLFFLFVPSVIESPALIGSISVAGFLSLAFILHFIRRKVEGFDSAIEPSSFQLRIWDFAENGLSRTRAADSVRNEIYREFGQAYVDEVLAHPKNKKAKSRFELLRPNTYGIRIEHCHAILLGGVIGILLSQWTYLRLFSSNFSSICSTPGRWDFHDEISGISIPENSHKILVSTNCIEYANVIRFLEIGFAISLFALVFTAYFFRFEIKYQEIRVVGDTVLSFRSVVQRWRNVAEKNRAKINSKKAKKVLIRDRRRSEKTIILRDKFDSTKSDL